MRTYRLYELDLMFTEHLDDNFEPVSILGYVYDAGLALKTLDPIAYRQELLAWISANWDEDEVREDVYYAKED